MQTPKQDKYLEFLQSRNNFLLVKNRSERANSAFYLPDSSFTYGKRMSGDLDNVGSLLTAWTDHKPSNLSQPDKDFRKLNALSVKEGASTASEQRRFRRSSDVRIKTATHRSKCSVPDIVFGDSARPSTPIKAVLGHFYGNQAAEQITSNYTPKSGKRVYSANRSTLGFDKRNKFIKASMKSDQKGLFKLKKFLSTQPRTSTRR